ncbi:MAG TPA: response regulator transcription factor [Solirubrobacterales bacterium]|nr:response regulator transcription factor [Solirubrobacterales bacterium]
MTSGEDAKLRVLVVDDHDVVQWGFRLLLEKQSWVERCLAASTGAEAVEVCRRLRPQVALVDMLLGGESGAEVCEEIRAASPSTRVLLISGAGVISPNVARSAGASGFISKDWSAVDVVKAVRMVSLGTEVFAEHASLDSPLSEREQEVLSLIATGSTNKEIASQLHLSPHTVKEHTSAIYRKLGVRNRAEATRQAQRLKILV